MSLSVKMKYFDANFNSNNSGYQISFLIPKTISPLSQFWDSPMDEVGAAWYAFSVMYRECKNASDRVACWDESTIL